MDALLTETQDGIRTLTLNRPDKLNAINRELGSALLEAIESASVDAAVRVVRLRGNGRAFCAGRDIAAPPTDQDLVLVQEVARAIVHTPKPVLAAVHGWTVGAGLEWMLNADVVIAAAGTRFRLPEASLGVFVTGGLSATLPAYAGLARTKALTLLGDAFTAQQAQNWGLVWHVVPDEDLETGSLEIATRLAALDPEVAGRFKRVLNRIGLSAFEGAIELENDAQRDLALRASQARSAPAD